MAEREKNSRRSSRRGSQNIKPPVAPEKEKKSAGGDNSDDVMKRRIMVRDPFNADNIEYKTVGEFIQDLEDHKKQLKNMEDEKDINNQLMGQVRNDNKKLKDELDKLMEEMEKRMQGSNDDMKRRRMMENVGTDTFGLEIKRSNQEAVVSETGGEDYFEMKKRISDLEDELRRARKENNLLREQPGKNEQGQNKPNVTVTSPQQQRPTLGSSEDKLQESSFNAEKLDQDLKR